jgi:hypothetical protein
MTKKQWRDILLNNQDKIIYRGRVCQLKADNLGGGVVEVYKDMEGRRRVMSEGYPENWKHAVVHFNPETKSIHFDRHFDSCSDEDIEIISGYWEGLKSENNRLREFLQKKPEPEKPDEDCPEDWDEEAQHDD